jgi:hypothetical protein
MSALAVTAEVEALARLDLEGLRTTWRRHWGVPPKLRSVELMRLMIAFRLQAGVLGGLDRETRRKLERTGRVRAEGLELGSGTVLRRIWKGEPVEVVVEAEGFRWQGRLYPSLSATARAIAGVRWNGPRFFGLREAAGARR